MIFRGFSEVFLRFCVFVVFVSRLLFSMCVGNSVKVVLVIVGMDSQSVREVIDTVESVSSGDLVVFEDSDGQTYKSSVVDVWSRSQRTVYELEGSFVLEVLYDHEGGPIKVEVTDGDKSVQVVAVEVEG